MKSLVTCQTSSPTVATQDGPRRLRVGESSPLRVRDHEAQFQSCSRWRRRILAALIFVPVLLGTIRLSKKRGWLWPSVLLMLASFIVAAASTVVLPARRSAFRPLGSIHLSPRTVSRITGLSTRVFYTVFVDSLCSGRLACHHWVKGVRGTLSLHKPLPNRIRGFAKNHWHSRK
jgi:hypothetical protein